MPSVEKRSISQKTMLKVIVGLIVAAIVIVFAGFVFMNASRLGVGWVGRMAGSTWALLARPSPSTWSA
jgi:hypothetical protein